MNIPYCPRNYYVLPADRCVDAIAQYNIARDNAMRAKREIWGDRYGATGALYNGGKRNGLVFSNIDALNAQYAIGGFCKAERLKGEILPENERGFVRHDDWLARPNRASKRGMQIDIDISHVGGLLEIWQWALERALGVYGLVFYNNGFHYTVARPLKDGRVIVSAAEDLNIPRSKNVSRGFDASTIPEWAQKISQDEYEALKKDEQ